MKALVEGYYPLKEAASPSRRMWVLVRLMDLDRALPRLTPPLFTTLWLVGAIGLTQLEASRLLGITQVAVHYRYHKALEQLTTCLNGGL